MMKNKFFALIGFGFLFSFILNSQDHPTGALAEQNLRALAGSNAATPVQSFNTAYEGLKGSPYLFDSWKTGDISLNIGEEVQSIKIKFDAYGNNLVFKHPETNDSLILNKGLVSSFNFSSDDFSATFLKIPIGQSSGFSLKFAELLYDGNIRLFRYHKKNLIEADYTGAYSANRPYDELVDDRDYYLQLHNGELIKLRTTRKGILIALADQKNALKSFMKKNKLKGKTDEELIAIVKFYDNLR